MPPIICPRCQRANPSDASFCYFDGINLKGSGPGTPITTDLGREFVFPSGLRSRTYDELVVGCSEDWPGAKHMLRQGLFRQFFASIGRMDLAGAADRAAAHQDPDLGLDQLLGQLPTSEETRPKLDLAPRRLHMPALNVGEQREFVLTIVNQGARLLHGTMEIEGDSWLLLRGSADGDEVAHHVPIKTGRKQQFQFVIKTAGLPAGQRYAAKLTLITNGGVAEVPLTVDVIPLPFQLPPLQGAATPRELATSMKEIPKQVYHLLENGTIRDWFIMNGWHYPVTGAQAKGIAAVQQFFEGLGLSKPPTLQIEPTEIKLDCQAGSQCRLDVLLQTNVKKWVYAHVEADQPWLKLNESDVSGAQRVGIQLQIDGRHMTAGQAHHGMINVVGNSNQAFHVPVQVQVAPSVGNFYQRFLQVILMGLLSGLFFRVVLLPVDLLARGFNGEIPPGYVQRFCLCLTWIGALAGGYIVWRRGKWADLPAGLLFGSVTTFIISASLANFIILCDHWLSQQLQGIALLPILLLSLLQWSVMGLSLCLGLWVLNSQTRYWLAEWLHVGANLCQKCGLSRLAQFLRS